MASRALLLSPAVRPLRFVGTGGTAGAVQLALLMVLAHRGWNAVPANAVAFLLAAQLNFGLSLSFTWRDRSVEGSLLRRWALFHASIALMALVNLAVFAVARLSLPLVMASLSGIGAGALGNYLLGDRLVFRDNPPAARAPTRQRPAA